MKKITSISSEDLSVINKQIKRHKQLLVLSPFIMTILLLIFIARRNGKMPSYFEIFVSEMPLMYVTIYLPLLKGIFLGTVIYNVKDLGSNDLLFVTFGTLWRREKIIKSNSLNIKADNIPFPKLLYNAYSLNVISIRGKQYKIFSKLLLELDLGNVS